MSIARLKKVTLFGLAGEKRELLEALQELGCLHLIPLSPAPTEVDSAALPDARDARKALRFLTDVPDPRRQVRRDPAFDVQAFVREVLELKQTLRDLEDRRDFLRARIAAVEPWGDLDFAPLEALAGHRLWFYRLPLGKARALEDLAAPWAIVRRDHRFAYVVVIAQEEPPAGLLPVPRTHTGASPLRALRAELDDAEVELEEVAARRHALTRFIYLLSANIAEAENQSALAAAERQTLDDAALVAVQGWAPEDSLEAIRSLSLDRHLACLIEDPRPDESPPTLIEQTDTMAAGADLSVFYQVPSYRSWDPSLLLFASFSVFFAMILADAGYGLLLLAALLLFWRRLGRTASGRSYRLLGLSLTGSAIAYGMLIGSYFGMPPGDGSLLARLNVLRVDDFETMMTVSIFVGALHIVLANGMTAWVNRGRRIAFASLGWIAGIIGGLLVWKAAPGSAPGTFGYGLIALGLGAVLFFNSERPVVRVTDHLWRFADGLKGVLGAMGAFGDVLSYMRLFALGLAGASLAQTFNALAADVHTALPGLGVLLAVLILAVGHVLNLGLSVMSGVVHGLRLNFIEFYKWGLPEEGTAFRRFARKEVQP
jgi:V/A-type H+-transporting ATPase subunit I